MPVTNPELPNAKAHSELTLLVLTNLLTATVVFGVMYYLNPSNNPDTQANQFAQVLAQNEAKRQQQLNDFEAAHSENKPQFEAVSEISLPLSRTEQINWTEGHTSFTITKITYGQYKLNSLPPNYNDKSFKFGEIVNAINFSLTVSSDKPDCAGLPHLRRIDAQDNEIAPNDFQFFFATGGCQIAANTPYLDEPLYFIVPADQKDFTFSYLPTGGLGIFKIKIANGQIQLKK